MKPLYKSTIVIWSEFEPTQLELEDLAYQATSGEAYCSKMEADLVEDPASDPDWDGTEFFGTGEENDR